VAPASMPGRHFFFFRHPFFDFTVPRETIKYLSDRVLRDNHHHSSSINP